MNSHTYIKEGIIHHNGNVSIKLKPAEMSMIALALLQLADRPLLEMSVDNVAQLREWAEMFACITERAIAMQSENHKHGKGLNQDEHSQAS